MFVNRNWSRTLSKQSNVVGWKLVNSRMWGSQSFKLVASLKVQAPKLPANLTLSRISALTDSSPHILASQTLGMTGLHALLLVPLLLPQQITGFAKEARWESGSDSSPHSPIRRAKLPHTTQHAKGEFASRQPLCGWIRGIRVSHRCHVAVSQWLRRHLNSTRGFPQKVSITKHLPRLRFTHSPSLFGQNARKRLVTMTHYLHKFASSQ